MTGSGASDVHKDARRPLVLAGQGLPPLGCTTIPNLQPVVDQHPTQPYLPSQVRPVEGDLSLDTQTVALGAGLEEPWLAAID